MAHRTSAGTYAGAGAAFRALLFDVMQSDETDGKIVFIPESRFLFVAKEREVWHFSLVVGLSTALASGETVIATLQHPAFGLLQASMVANTATANYFPHLSVTWPLNPGDTVQPQIYSGSVGGNNPHAICEFTGCRVG